MALLLGGMIHMVCAVAFIVVTTLWFAKVSIANAWRRVIRPMLQKVVGPFLYWLVIENLGRRVLEVGLAGAVIGLWWHTSSTPPVQRTVVKLMQQDLAASALVVHASGRIAEAPPREVRLVLRRVLQTRVVTKLVRIYVHSVQPPVNTRAWPCLPPSTYLPQPGPCGDRWMQAEQPNPDGIIDAPPSVSEEAIEAALTAASSPTASVSCSDGTTTMIFAEWMWRSGLAIGIDPAVVMAIFRHESQYGTVGMARLTYSIGNIRPLSDQPNLMGYRYYRTWCEAATDAYRLLAEYVRGGANTVQRAIPVWAPPSDNNDDSAYIGSVLSTMSSLYANSAITNGSAGSPRVGGGTAVNDREGQSVRHRLAGRSLWRGSPHRA